MDDQEREDWGGGGWLDWAGACIDRAYEAVCIAVLFLILMAGLYTVAVLALSALRTWGG